MKNTDKLLHNQVTSTSSVRNLWSIPVSFISILTPPWCITRPVQAIIAPLSEQRSGGGTKQVAFLPSAISHVMSKSLRFLATPPPSNTSSFPRWAIALSVTSTSIAKLVSCKA